MASEADGRPLSVRIARKSFNQENKDKKPFVVAATKEEL
jgi:hypothetical protein